MYACVPCMYVCMYAIVVCVIILGFMFLYESERVCACVCERERECVLVSCMYVCDSSVCDYNNNNNM